MVKKVKPQIRFLNEMKKVLYDQKWAKEAPNFPVYYMYRGIKEKNNLRYDITDITPQMLGQEFPKTKGHQHPLKCLELIKVLEGRVIFLFQKCRGKKILDVYQIPAKKGDWVLAPSGYSHITINPGPKKLKIANWLNKKCKWIYNFIEKMGGACYYYTKSGWIKNKNYGKILKLSRKKPLKSTSKNLDFLKD